MHKFHLGISDSEVILRKRQFSVVPCWHNKKTTKPPLNGHIYLFNYPLTLAGILNLIFCGITLCLLILTKANLKGARNNIVNYFMGLAFAHAIVPMLQNYYRWLPYKNWARDCFSHSQPKLSIALTIIENLIFLDYSWR